MLNQPLLQEFDIEMANTRKILEGMPEDKLDWRPHPKSFPMGHLATHVATLPFWALATLTRDAVDVGRDEMPSLEAGTKQDILALFDKNVADARAVLAAASDESLMAPWSLMNNGQAFFTMPRIAVMRGFVMNHLIHHRAQLGLYLRQNDIPLPAMYGPTADESFM